LSRRRTGDRGSTLILMPVAVLIMIVLGSIAADLSYLHMVKRDLLSVANSAANDGATFGIDTDALRAPAAGVAADAGALDLSGSFEIGRANAAIDRNIAIRRQKYPDLMRDPAQPTEWIPATRTVRVHLRATVTYVFGRSLPGGLSQRTLTATGSAFVQSR
jgi:hypothetical protein